VLEELPANLFGRVARRELVSVRLEIRAALYAGVLLLTSGVGLFLKENHERIGPAAIGIAIGVGAAACLAWASRRSTPFTWGEAASAHPAFDYVLLLGALLFAADLAYLEA
jgi:4-hydroxybenzoate polyprenyltransferase